MLASEMDIQIGLAPTGSDGLVVWTYPTPFASAPLVLGSVRDPVVAGYNISGTDNVGALVVMQLATHTQVKAQVFMVTAGPLVGLTPSVKVAPAGVDVNFVAFWPITGT